ncbi:hypothetical protein [Leptospira noguchii]|nr:hypothetical protein [Leptospira noguchii]UOG35270.1 hypothetical protein MAL02_06105 [Leptospira noguchii]
MGALTKLEIFADQSLKLWELLQVRDIADQSLKLWELLQVRVLQINL